MCLGSLLPVTETDLITEVLTLQGTRRTPLEIPQSFHVERQSCLLSHCLRVPPAADIDTIMQEQAEHWARDPKTYLLEHGVSQHRMCEQIDTTGNWGQFLGSPWKQC